MGDVQRFRAEIRIQGPNPYVDIPERISRAFAPLARAGRIAVVGKLGKREIRGTLIPVGGGRHRLFLNSGARIAAGVEVGDRASLALRATAPEAVRPPTDVAAALRDAGARDAFDALPPSHRRELVRYIDDARTPETRQRRIASSIDHVLGRRVPAAGRATGRALWTCPRCGHEFVTPNQYHSCERHDLADAFQGKPARIRELFDRLRAMVEALGSVKLVAYRHNVAFMVRVRFVGAVPRTRWLDVLFWLTRRIDDRRFHKIETLYPNAHIHTLRVTAPEDLDGEVAGWLREAYAVGCQEHLRSS